MKTSGHVASVEALPHDASQSSIEPFDCRNFQLTDILAVFFIWVIMMGNMSVRTTAVVSAMVGILFSATRYLSACAC